MKRINKFYGYISLLVSWLPLLTVQLPNYAEEVRCSVCQKVIRGQYFRDNQGNPYCSRECFNKTLPKCSICGQPATNQVIRWEGKVFCSRKCLEGVLPKCDLCRKPMTQRFEYRGYQFCPECANLPRCSECGFPTKKGKEYPDKRIICDHCSQYTLHDPKDVQPYYLRACEELEQIVRKKVKILPNLRLVGIDEIHTHLSYLFGYQVQGLIRGYYHREELINPENIQERLLQRKSVFMLYGMKANHYVLTGVHELMHDITAEYYPDVHFYGPGWLKEGLCQYVSFMVAWKYQLENYYTEFIDHSDPNYGEGFRYLIYQFGINQWTKIESWLNKTSIKALPSSIPSTSPEKIWQLIRSKK